MGSLGFINFAQLDAGHLWHIIFVFLETCHNDPTIVRACSLALLGLRVFVAIGGNDSMESVCMFDENTVLGVWTFAFQPCLGTCFQWAAVRWPGAQSLSALGLPGLLLAAEFFFFRSLSLFFRPRVVARRGSHPQDAEMFRDLQPAQPGTKRAVGGRHCVGGG